MHDEHQHIGEPQVAAGWSESKDTSRALDEALRGLEELEGDAGVVFVYAGVSHDHRQILSGLRGRLGQVPLAGCSFTGGICPDGFLQHGLVVAALGAESVIASVGHGDNVFAEPYDAGRRAALMALDGHDFSAPEFNNRVCVIHNAGFTIDKKGVEEDVLKGVKEVLKEEWIIVGGSAGDDARFLRSFQLANEQVLEHGIVVTLLSTDLKVAHAMEHGFVPTGRRFTVTEAEDKLVRAIDGRLAQDLYAELLSVPASKLTAGLGVVRLSDKMPRSLVSFSQKLGLTPKKITQAIPFFNLSIESPFGVRQTDEGSHVVKVPKMVTPEGFIEFYTRIPEGTELELMRLDRELTVGASSRALSRVNAALDGKPKLVLVFECLGRYLYLHKEIDALVKKIGEQSATRATVGFFSSAEQGQLEGQACQAHNYTTVALGFGGR